MHLPFWEKKPVDSQEVNKFAERYGVSRLVATIFLRRGIEDPSEVGFVIEDTLQFTHNPFSLPAMKTAVDRTSMAIEEGEKVLIFGDRDVDGVTSTALLHNALSSYGVKLRWRLPRKDEHYGLSPEAIEEAAERGETLIFTVDTGTSSTREIALAREKGIDVIIMDHHSPQEELPDAWAIINPRINDEYPFPTISACAIVGKFVWALAFSFTEFYNTPLCIVTAFEEEGVIIVEAVKFRNFITEKQIRKVIASEEDRYPLLEFLEGENLFVFDEKAQNPYFEAAFGATAEIRCLDFAPETLRYFPGLAGAAPDEICRKGRFARYSTRPRGRANAFVELFLSVAYRKLEEPNALYQSGIDLMTLSTLADMMPLKNENLIIVKAGLKRLYKAPHPALRELMLRLDLHGRPLSSKEVSWKLTPVINAAGRMGQAEKAVELLITTDENKRTELSEELKKLNKERQKIGEKSWESCREQAHASFEANKKQFVLIRDDEIPRGITGIIASRLSAAYGVPAGVVTGFELGGDLSGSLRSPDHYTILPLLEAAKEILDDFGGHPSAGGFRLEAKRYPQLSSAFAEAAKTLQPGEKEVSFVDAELPQEYMTSELWDIVQLFEPFGEKNSPLLFLVKNVTINSAEIIGQGHHLRLGIDAGGVIWPSLYWGGAERYGRDFAEGDQVNLLFSIEKNYFRGTEKLQLIINGIERCHL